MPDINVLKKYLRIDGSEDDDVLALLMAAARTNLAETGISEITSESGMYDLAVFQFVALHYENRDPSISIEKMNAAYQNLILKLKDY